jgi:hypothetical protein
VPLSVRARRTRSAPGRPVVHDASSPSSGQRELARWLESKAARHHRSIEAAATCQPRFFSSAANVLDLHVQNELDDRSVSTPLVHRRELHHLLTIHIGSRVTSTATGNARARPADGYGTVVVLASGRCGGSLDAGRFSARARRTLSIHFQLQIHYPSIPIRLYLYRSVGAESHRRRRVRPSSPPRACPYAV